MSESHDTFREDVKEYIAQDREYKKSMDKILKALTDDVWGTSDDNPGIKRKTDAHETILANAKEDSKFWRAIFAVPLAGLVVQWFWDLAHRIK
jgi:hypothetical protein